jgi:beta-lactamase class A
MKEKQNKSNLFLRIVGSRTLAYSAVIVLTIMLLAGKSKPAKVAVVNEYDPCSPKVDVSRHEVNRLTRPYLLNDEYVECGNLSVVKDQLTQYIDDEKKKGNAADISVYLRKPSTLSWFEINGSQMYMPSSIMKISIMVYYLLEARIHPEVMQQKIYFGQHNEDLNRQNILSDQLRPNRDYTIYELLQALMAHSDNDASSLLAKNMDEKVYKELFSDLNLPEPDIFHSDYTMNVVQCSKFFRLLFNSNYLGRDMSEMGLELMTHCDFKDGIMKGVDSTVTVAHKFGERSGNGFKELHEGGIIYVDNHPYILCVMTRGTDYDKLSDIIGNISRIAYENLK